MKHIDLETIRENVDAGWLTERRSGDLSIFNYTTTTQYEGHWNDITRMCRGLIVDQEGYVIALPWSKFFNFGEKHSEPAPTSTPWGTVKEDGSLGILYPFEGGSRWATRGSMESEQAEAANAMWGDRASEPPPEDWTVLAEIIHPSSRVVVPYSEDRLVVLGARSRTTGADIARDRVADWAFSIGLGVVPIVSDSLRGFMERVGRMDHTEEGFVLHWERQGEWLRIKVKSEAYRKVHRLVQSMTSSDGFSRRVGDIWYSQEWALVDALPDGIREDVRAEVDRLEALAEIERQAISHRYRSIIAENPSATAKDVALASQGPDLHALMALHKGTFDPRSVVYRREFGGKPRR